MRESTVGVITLKDGTNVEDRRLDRLVEFDEKSRNFPARTLTVVKPTLRSVAWYCPAWLDQGQEGKCVAYAWAHELAAVPVKTSISQAEIDHIYYEAQKVDDWEGGSYPGAKPFYEGTSVLAGAKIVNAMGYMGEYRWAFSCDEALQALSHQGPLVIGVNWYQSMFEPRPSGLLEVDHSAQPAGGHAILVRGLALKSRLRGEPRDVPVVRLRNSWGQSWGLNGDCFLKVEDFEWILAQQGECCVPVARNRPIPDRRAAVEDLGVF